MANRGTRAGMLSCVLGVALASMTAPQAAYSDFNEFSSAVNYCSKHPHSIKLSEDRTILCFDGPIFANRDTAAFSDLKQNGLFVVRSTGGFAPTAIILSNILLEKNATVIVYDYCLSACANYFLIASSKTYVMKNTVVAWHGGPAKRLCAPDDIEAMKRAYRNVSNIEIYPSPELACKTGELLRAFFKERSIDDRHTYEPQTAHTRKMFDMAVREAMNKRRILWMWNPQNYGDHFKSRVIYESYPSSQDEIDGILSRLRLDVRVFHDPPRF
jgi:hypothetical protein